MLQLTMQNPMALYEAGVQYLEAIEAQNIAKIFPPPIPSREDDPYKENAAALMPMPQIPPAYPDQDHVGHIAAHNELARGKGGEEGFTATLTPEGKKALEDHIQMHIALMYEAQHGPRQVPQGANGDMGPSPGMAVSSVDGEFGAAQGSA